MRSAAAALVALVPPICVIISPSPFCPLRSTACPFPQTMRIKLSEPEYVGQGEWVQLRFNFTNKRSFYKTFVAADNGSFVVPVR